MQTLMYRETQLKKDLRRMVLNTRNQVSNRMCLMNERLPPSLFASDIDIWIRDTSHSDTSLLLRLAIFVEEEQPEFYGDQERLCI